MKFKYGRKSERERALKRGGFAKSYCLGRGLKKASRGAGNIDLGSGDVTVYL